MVSKNYSIVDKIKTDFLKKWKISFLSTISKKQKKSSNIIISIDTYDDLLDELEE